MKTNSIGIYYSVLKEILHGLVSNEKFRAKPSSSNCTVTGKQVISSINKVSCSFCGTLYTIIFVVCWHL